jgi:hypothetical protein
MNYGNRLNHLRYLYKKKIGESLIPHATPNINRHGASSRHLDAGGGAVVEFYSEDAKIAYVQTA